MEKSNKINENDLEAQINFSYVKIATNFCYKFIPLAKVIFTHLNSNPKAEKLFDNILGNFMDRNNTELFQMGIQVMLNREKTKYFTG